MASAQAVSLSAYWRLLRANRNFRLLWLAQVISENGDWLYVVAVYSLILELTGSAMAVSFALVLQLLPHFFLGPTAGVINDRFSRKRIMVLADLARAAIVLSMLVVRSSELIWLLYVLLFLETVMWTFFEPGRNAVIPNITEDNEELLAANALGSMTWSFNLAMGSALGGAIAVLLGRNTVFGLNALSFLLSALLVTRMRFAEPHAETRHLSARDLVDYSAVLDGARYMFHHRRIRATLLLKGGLGLSAAHWVILPIFGEKIFPVHIHGVDPSRSGMLGMSLLMAARGVGALIGPFVAGYWAGSEESRLRRGALLGFLCLCSGYLLLGAAPNIAVAIAGIALSNAGGSTIWVFSSALLQVYTEDRFRGRVFSADFGFMTLAMSTTTWIAGVAYDAGAPVRAIAYLSGLSALAPALLWVWAQRYWASTDRRTVSN